MHVFREGGGAFRVITTQRRTIRVFNPHLGGGCALECLFFILTIVDATAMCSSSFITVLAPIIDSSIDKGPLSMAKVSSRTDTRMQIAVGGAMMKITVASVLNG